MRTPVEYREVHVPFARNVPLDQLDPATVQQGRTAPGEPLYVICRSGGRGRQACEKLAAAGLAVCNVEGGTQAWADAGLPVVRGTKAVSLERQVRIAAGLLVLVGAGLVFAGVTDTCGMGLLLARMPWNRATDPAACGVR